MGDSSAIWRRLQGLLSSDRKDAIYYTNTESRVNYAIYNAKELIKQLKILKQLDL